MSTIKMKLFLLMAIFVTCPIAVSAQDIPVRKSGEVENVKVLEVSPTEVKYKKSNNEDGPVFIEKRSNLFSVKYKNGEVQIFNEMDDASSRKDTEQKVVGVDGQNLNDGSPNKISVRNQFGEAQRLHDDSEKGGALSPYNNNGRFTHELDFYIADGWGIGYQLRREFNPYIGWNIVGISYVSRFGSPADDGLLDIKLLGVRGYTPSYKAIRGYVGLNVGYSFAYEREIYLRYIYYNNKYYYDEVTEMDTNHRFGVDISIGIQVHKNIAIGYNMKFHALSSRKMHFAKVAVLF